MKKLMAFFLASVLTLSLCSCWGGSSPSNLPTDSGVEDVSVEEKDNVEMEETEKELDNEK